MAKVEDVSITISRGIQHSLDPRMQNLLRSKERDRIQIALHGHMPACQTPALIQRHAPVQAEHIRACFAHGAQQ